MSVPVKLIDTVKFSDRLRDRSIDVPNQQVLISRLIGSEQEVDLSLPTNCGGFGRIRHFKQQTAAGWPSNPLPIVPAVKALGLSAVPAVMQAQVFQNAACAWRCWYCFVPDALLKADPRRSQWFKADELVAMYRDEPNRPQIMDLSGGSPDLVPEWTIWMMRSLKKFDLDKSTYLWTDDNLSTRFLFDKIGTDDLNMLRSYRNYGRVCCFKGFNKESFAFNTRANADGYDNQFSIMRDILGLGLDVYGYVTLTSPQSQNVPAAVNEFIDRLQTLDPNLPLRIVPLQIRIFSPVGARIEDVPDRERSLRVQEDAIAVWCEELERRFPEYLRRLPIADVCLRTREA